MPLYPTGNVRKYVRCLQSERIRIKVFGDLQPSILTAELYFQTFGVLVQHIKMSIEDRFFSYSF